MGDGKGKKHCENHPLSSYPVKYPKSTSISLKNLKNSIGSKKGRKENDGCESYLILDVRKNHVRNRRLLDSPFNRAKCCSEIYNMIMDRQKLKRLKKFDMTRPVRTIQTYLEPEEVARCVDPEEMSGEKKESAVVHLVAECYPVSECDSCEEEDEYYRKTCDAESLSECSGCETLGEVKRLKVHVVPHPRWQDLLYGNEVEYCQKIVDEIMTKYKGKTGAMLKFDKIVLKENSSKIL